MPVGARQLPRGPAPAVSFQVHRQERQIACNVHLAQRRVELDPINHTDLRAEQYVLAAQVPVPVAHQPPLDAPLKLTRMSSHERLTEPAHRLHPPAGRERQAFDLLHVHPPTVQQLLWPVRGKHR